MQSVVKTNRERSAALKGKDSAGELRLYFAERSVRELLYFFSCIFLTNERIIYKSILKGGEHGKESGSESSGKGSGKEGNEESSEARRKGQEVVA